MLRLIIIVILCVLGQLSTCGRSEDDQYDKLLRTFDRATQLYPSDSARLANIYFKWVKSRDERTTLKQINSLEILLSKETQATYHRVAFELRPLLTTIVNGQSISAGQGRKIVSLYSAYDHLSGEGLFVNLLHGDDNYQLVWKSFEKIAAAANKDTVFIWALVTLNDSIRTNVELAEAMPDFLMASIRNNPEGFLQMYGRRDKMARREWASFIAPYDTPDREIMTILQKLSRSAGDPKKSAYAKEIIESTNKGN